MIAKYAVRIASGCFLVALLLIASNLIQTVHAAKPDSIKDVLSDSRSSTAAIHDIYIDLSAGIQFEPGETILIDFPTGFTSVDTLTDSDITLFKDGLNIKTIQSAACGATDTVRFEYVVGNQIRFTACNNYTGGAGNIIEITIGSTNKVVNGATAGSHLMTIAGTYGDDSANLALNITPGGALSTTVSLTISASTGSVQFLGDAFPFATVTFLDNGAVAGTTVALGNSSFSHTLSGLSPGVHTFSIYATAEDGRTTLTISFGLNVISGMTITVSGILLPAIISTPNTIKRPQYLTQSGLAKTNSTVTTFTTNVSETITRQAGTNASGQWGITVNQILHLGPRTSRALVTDAFGTMSELSEIKNTTVELSADLNIDSSVNLTDFSILMYNYGGSPPPNLAADINDDGPTDLVDFSIMMFFWTG